VRAPIRRPARLRGEIWGVSTYFNPAGYTNKTENLRLFAKNVRRQNLKLLIVELAFKDSPFEFEPELADKIIRIRSDSVLWQKERLLNLAIQNLPDTCDAVVCLDADILFENDDWVNETVGLLEEYVVVQPFDVACWLPPNVRSLPRDRGPNEPCDPILTMPGAAYGQIHQLGDAHPGFAWASRRALLQVHGLYDRFIVGGGDLLFTLAISGHSELEGVNIWLRDYCSDAHAADVLKWASALYADVKGSVFYTKGSVFHLWHGNSENRSYSNRYQILKDADFDPHADICLNQYGCWEWNNNKQDLQRRVRDYFWARREQV